MRTDKQIEASRANGTKSQGPTTPEGKAASSQNATTHGLTSRHPLLLNVEQQAAFQDHMAVETDIVQEMVTIQWRRQRGEAMEATLVQLTMDRMAADVEKQFNNCPHSTRIAMAMEHLEENGKAMGNFQRHTLRLSRQFLRLHKTLRELQADHATAPTPAPVAETQIEQIEPKDQQPEPHQPIARPTVLGPAAVLAQALAKKPASSEIVTGVTSHEATKCAGN